MTAYGPRGGRLYRRKTWDGKAIWVADYMGADGKRRRKSLSSDKRVAEKQFEIIVQERDLAQYAASATASQDALLQEVVDSYVADLQSSKRPRYVASVRDSLGRILKAIDARRVRDVSIPKILEYRKGRREGVSPRTCNIETGALRACLQWALRSGGIVINPLANLKRLRLDEANQKKKRRALTEREIALFLEAARREDEDRASFRAAEKTIENGTKGRAFAQRERVPPIPQGTMWLAFISTGLRWGEVASLRWTDLDSEGRSLVVRAEVAKGRRDRLVPVTAELMRALRDLKAANARTTGRMPGPDDPIFLSPLGCQWATVGSSNARKLLYATFERAGIPRMDERGRSLDIHGLRGTCATRLLRNKVQLAHVAQMLGHKDVRLTMRHYADLGLEDLRAEVDRVPAIGGKPPKPPRQIRRAASQRAS